MGNLGFTFRHAKNGVVVVEHHGKFATILRGDKADWFIQQMNDLDFAGQQQNMARVTGNYRRGNERKGEITPQPLDLAEKTTALLCLVPFR